MEEESIRPDDVGRDLIADHTGAVLAREYEIEHIFAFNRDFTTLGLTRVPADIHFLV